MRRVVVTGLGMVTPLGCGVDTTWTRILDGQSGARKIDTFEVADLASQIACVIPRGDGSDGTFNPDQWMEPKDQRKVDDFIIFAMAAARQALDDADWHPSTEEDKCATGTLIGSGIGGLSGIADTALLLKERGPRKVSPFFIPGRLINLASGYVSIEHGLKGPNHSVVTACSTGAHAIGDGSRLIALGDADVMVAGGTESPICRLAMAGFCAARALSTGFNETPEKASRPYDKDRDGFVMGEGAGIVVLEEYEHAKKRGAKIYAEVVGYGLSGDAYHITSPAPDGDGGFRSMSAAIKRAGNRGYPISTTSTPTEPRRRSATRSNSARSSGCSATTPRRCRCRRPNRRPGICWVPPVRSRRFSVSLRFAITLLRPPSIWKIRRWKRRSIWCRRRRASVRSTSRCRIPSVSGAPMPP